MLPFRPADVPAVDLAELSTTAPHLVPLLARVRATVVAHVIGRRASGVPLERVVIEVRTLVRDAAASLLPRDGGERDAMELLLAAVERWSVAAYGRAEFAPRRVAHDRVQFGGGRGSQSC